MSPYLIVAIGAALLGAAIGGGTTHVLDANHYSTQLADERAAHARDNEQNADKLKAVSDAAAAAEQKAIADGKVAAGKIATLDQQYTQEQASHEADNAKNRAAIADGQRRLRIAVTNYVPAGGNAAGAGTGASSVGDGAGGTAELSPAAGSALFGIVDDADSDARAKASYLQQYVCTLQQQGVVAGTCSS